MPPRKTTKSAVAGSPAGRIPPQNTEAEKSVLGSLLLDRDAIVKVADLLQDRDFYVEAHRTIYAAVLELYRRHSVVDLLTVTNVLKEGGQLDTVGGASYVAELTESVPTASHITEYAEIVRAKATLRRLIHAGSEIAGLGFDEQTEIAQTLEEAERKLFDVSGSYVKTEFTPIRTILDESYDRLAALHDSGGQSVRGIPTGLSDLDLKLSGLQRSDLVVLAARPSMGKTALALNIAQNVAKSGKTVGIFSLEMSKDQLVERMFCSLIGIDSWKLRTGQLSDDDFSRIGDAMDELAQMQLYIDDTPGASVIELRTKARRLQSEVGLDLIIVDYIQLMRGNNPMNRVAEMSDISRSLKLVARELNVPLVALSQLNRAVETRDSKIPNLSDLRESGSIEQDADVVMFIYRDDYYNEDSQRPGETDLLIKKHRNGPTGKVVLMFDKQKQQFRTIDSAHATNYSEVVVE